MMHFIRWSDFKFYKLVPGTNIYTYVSQKIDFYIPCKLSLQETICMECKILFSRKVKTTVSKCLSHFFFPGNPCFVWPITTSALLIMTD